MRISTFVLVHLVALVVSCTTPTARVCDPGAVQECPCGGGRPAGTQPCDEAGQSWEACLCEEAEAEERPAPEPPPAPDADDSVAFEPGEGTTKLLPPRREGGMPLMEALAARRSSREYGTKRLPAQTMSDLLWAAFGVSRPDLGKRTAPSARNRQEIDLYLTLPEGVYLYRAEEHALQKVLDQDLRAQTGKQPFPAEAPLNIVYVADFSKMEGSSDEDRLIYSAADAAFISENVYLYCASKGLATVVRGWLDREELTKALELRPDQRVVLAQTVGYLPE